MNTSYLEETKKNATKGFSTLAVKAVSVLVYLYLWMCMLITQFITILCTPRLESQSDKDYARDKYATRERNGKNAYSRKHNNLHVPKNNGKNNKKKNVRNNGKILGSQAGYTIFDFDFSTGYSILDYFKLFKTSIDIPYVSREEFDVVWKKFLEFLSEITIFQTISKDFMTIIQCDIAKTLFSLISMIVTLGWMPKVDYKFRGVTLFESEAIKQKVTMTMIYETLCKLFKLVKEACFKFPEYGIRAFYLDEHKLKYEIEVADLRAQKVLIDVGRETTMDALEFDRRVEEIIQETLKQMAIAQGHEKTVLNNILKEFKGIQASRILAKRDYIREKPYGILMYGGSAVGKSAMSNSLIRYVLEVNGMDSSPRSIIVLNEFDKFQSEYRTHHSGVIFDDLCNGNPDKNDGNPLMKVIQFINNAPQAALNPNVEMKGNVMIEPRVVLATTNVKDLNARTYSEEPLSIARRFQVTITQSVRKEYCKPGTKMIDASKILEDFGNNPYPDFALFDVQYAKILEGQADDKHVGYEFYRFEGKLMEQVDIHTLLRFLREDSQKHFSEQKQFVINQKSNEHIHLCQCGLPISVCKECELESQFFKFPNLTQSLLDCEEYIYSIIISCLLYLVDTPFGQGLLAYHVRKAVLTFYESILEQYFMKISLIALIILELLCHGFLGARFILMFLFLIFGSVYLLYLKYKYQFKNKIRNLPKISTWIINMDFRTKMKILSFLGGVSTLTAFIKFVKYLRTLPTAQAAAPIRILPNEGVVKEDEHPKWGISGIREKEKAFKIESDVHHDVRTMTPDEMFNSLKRRQFSLRIDVGDAFTFCNCVPMKSNVMLIPNHIVPKKTSSARLSKPGAPYKGVYIQPESVYKIPNTDFALWYLPELGDQKDITNYLPKFIPQGKRFESFLMYNNNGTIERYDKMLGCRSVSRSTEGGRFESVTYSFPGQTFKGLCMATLISNELGSIPFIGGFHLAGSGSAGAAGFLTKEQVESGITELNKKAGIMISHSATPFQTTLLGVNVGPLLEPHEKAVVHQLKPEAKCTVFGQHNQPRSTPSSRVVTSMISSAVTKHLDLPKIHGPPCEMKDDRHQLVDIEGKTDTAYKFQLDSFNKAYDDYLDQIMNGLNDKHYAKIGKLSIDAILAGYDGVKGINSMEFSTAAGFPLKGTKRQFVEESQRFVEGISCPRDVNEEILDEMRRIEKELSEGKRVNTVFKASLKDEPVKTTKTKVRVFAGSNMPFTMLVRKYFLTLSALMQDEKELFECACGVNVYSPEWDVLMNHVFKHGKERMIAGDYKAFDGRMSPRFMLAAFKILIEIATKSGNYDDGDIIVMKGIAAEITNPTYDHFGTLIQFFGSNPSGHPLTVVINSIVNSLYMRYCYYEIAKEEKWWKVPRFNKAVALMTYGDDNIMSVAKGYDAFNHTRVAKTLANAGLEYTMADKESESVPYITAAEAGFLKHNAVYDEELKLYRAVIEENSIQKTLHTHLKSDVLSEEMHSASAITDVLDKYFHFGEEIYNKRKSELEEVARECGLVGYVGELKTYKEQMIRFCENYAWPMPSKYQA
jgi:hypothetical protein